MRRQQKVLLNFLVIVFLLFYGITSVTIADDLTITHAYSLYSGSVSVDFGPNGNYIATGDVDGDVGFWEVGNDEVINYVDLGDQVKGVAFSPDGRYLAADGDDGNVIVRLLDVATRTTVRSRYIHRDATRINSVAFSPDSRYVAVGMDVPWAYIWDLNSGEIKGWGLTDSSEFYDVAFSPDGKYLATGNDNGDLTLWELTSWWTDNPNKIDLKPGGNVQSVAFSPDGKYLAADGYDGNNTYVNIYDMNSRRVAWQIPAGNVYAIAFSPNGEYIALGDTEATITFYKIGANLTPVGEITASDEVLDLAWSPDGTMISDGRDVWNVTQPTPTPPDDTDTIQESDVTVSFTPSTVSSPAIGEQLTLSLNITGGENVSGYQATVNFDTTALKYVQSDNGDYLPAGAFFIPPKVDGNTVTLAATSLSGASNGDGTLATITFEIVAAKASTLTLSDVLLTDSAGGSSAPQLEATQITEPTTPPPPVVVTTVGFTPSTVSSPAIGEQLTFSLSITGGENVAGYQATVNFDTTALKYVQSDNGNYLPSGAFFIPPKVDGNTVTLAATSLSGASNGDGTLATLTFEIVAAKASTLTLSDVLLTDSASGSSTPQVEATQITEPTTPPPPVVVTTVGFTPSTVSSPAIGEQLTFSLSITGGENVAGYQATVTFDTTALKYVQSDNGDYLPTGAFFIPPKVDGNTVTLAATSLSGASNGDGTLATLTFEIVAAKASTLILSDVLLTNSAGGSSTPQVEATQITEPSPMTNGIGLTLPPDLISEVASTTNSTYFIVNAKYPMMTGVSDANILYGSCIITLQIPENMQGFVFPIKTVYDDAVDFLISVGVNLIPLGGTLLDALDLFSKVNNSQNRELKIELHTDARHSEPPNTEMECIVLLKHPVNEIPSGIDITIEQQYKDTAKSSTRIEKVSESKRWNFDDGWAASPAQTTIFDYPPFQLLPAEVQQYLLLQFLEFGTTESELIPKETALLANYPNPFNPETWIPYQIAKPANVSISIYTADGQLVRKLDLGQQAIGIYKSRSRAAYWDGKNALGEPIASGVYFYTLKAGDFSGTRKMLIRK